MDKRAEPSASSGEARLNASRYDRGTFTAGLIYTPKIMAGRVGTRESVDSLEADDANGVATTREAL